MKKNKWLVVQSNLEYGPYGSENCEFLRECYSLKYALEQNGQEADIWGFRHKDFTHDIDFNKYDYIFLEEQYEFDWIPFERIGKSSAVKIQLVGDIHVHQTFLKWSHLFDVLLHPIRHWIPRFEQMFPTKKHIWYPSAFDNRYYFHRNLPKIYDVIWMGSPTRRYIKELQRDVGLIQMLKGGQGYIDALAQAKVVVNSRSSEDVSYKNYETIGVGSCLVTYYDSMLIDLGFVDGINCYMYKNYDEFVFKIRQALEDYNWSIVGGNGYYLSKTNDYISRIKQLLLDIH